MGCERCELDRFAALLERVQRRESIAHSCSPDLVGASEAARLAGVSRPTIYAWVSAGELQAQPNGGKAQRFKRRDVLDVAQRRARPV